MKALGVKRKRAELKLIGKLNQLATDQDKRSSAASSSATAKKREPGFKPPEAEGKGERKVQENAVYFWDFTLKWTDDIEQKTIVTWLNTVAKQWVFQKEQSDAGYMHWQGRMNRKAKTRALFLIQDGMDLEGHASVTSTKGSKTFNYVTKVDTRVLGPWADNPTRIEEHKMPLQLEGKRPFVWQQEILDDMERQTMPEHYDTRLINVLYDPSTMIGKSWLKTYARWNKKALIIPPLDKPEDLIASVMDRPISTAYILDLPKDLTKKQRQNMNSGLEMLKDGVVWDKRHEFRERMMNSPSVWVFTNTFPDLSKAGKGRYKIWMVDWTEHLVEHTPARAQNICDWRNASRRIEPTAPIKAAECDSPWKPPKGSVMELLFNARRSVVDPVQDEIDVEKAFDDLPTDDEKDERTEED